MHKCAPVRLVRSTASQSSSLMRRASVSRVMAALLTRMSSLPNFASNCWKPVFTWAASATSMGTARASPPAAAISDASEASFSVLRAAMATFAPASARARDVARPMPCDAPVTRATLSLSENIGCDPIAYQTLCASEEQFLNLSLSGVVGQCFVRTSGYSVFLAQIHNQPIDRINITDIGEYGY